MLSQNEIRASYTSGLCVALPGFPLHEQPETNSDRVESTTRAFLGNDKKRMGRGGVIWNKLFYKILPLSKLFCR